MERPQKFAKLDISQAFGLLIVNPADFDLLGIKFDGKFYIDKCLPMGCAISCSLFEKFSTFVHWVVKSKAGLDSMDHYLDDFIFAGNAITDNCEVLVETFLHVSQELGVPIAEKKTVCPTNVLTFLGLEIDTVLMMVKIPALKLDKLKRSLQDLLTRKKENIRTLESVIGLMAFCARARPSARAFLRRFYDLLSSVKVRKPFYKIRITEELKYDITVWLQFLEDFNGECYILENLWLTNEALELFTDSTGNQYLGCDAYSKGHWLQFSWPESWGGGRK